MGHKVQLHVCPLCLYWGSTIQGLDKSSSLLEINGAQQCSKTRLCHTGKFLLQLALSRSRNYVYWPSCLETIQDTRQFSTEKKKM